MNSVQAGVFCRRFPWHFAVALSLLGAGCSPSTPEAAPAGTPAESTPALEQSQPQGAPSKSGATLEPKLAEYKEAVEAYLSKARAAADTLEAVPSPERAMELVEEFNRLYSALPAAPTGLDDAGHIQTPLNNIRKSFIVAESIAKLQGDITVKQQLTVMANDLRGFVKKAESKMAEAGL